MAYGGALLRRWAKARVGSNPTPSVPSRRAMTPSRDLDGWPSGLRRTTGNRVGASPRGFESHPVRFTRRRPIMLGWPTRGVAQSGRALRSGRRGPRFESGRPD